MSINLQWDQLDLEQCVANLRAAQLRGLPVRYEHLVDALERHGRDWRQVADHVDRAARRAVAAAKMHR
jgi:hypothetical protein